MNNFDCVFCVKNHKMIYSFHEQYVICSCKKFCSIEYVVFGERVKNNIDRIIINPGHCLCIYYITTEVLLIIDNKMFEVIDSVKMNISTLVESFENEDYIKNLLVLL